MPANQLPSYVDDVLDYADFASFPATGEAGKIYVAIDTGFIYRWATSVYIKISDVLSASRFLSGSDIPMMVPSGWSTIA